MFIIKHRRLTKKTNNYSFIYSNYHFNFFVKFHQSLDNKIDKINYNKEKKTNKIYIERVGLFLLL